MPYKTRGIRVITRRTFVPLGKSHGNTSKSDNISREICYRLALLFIFFSKFRLFLSLSLSPPLSLFINLYYDKKKKEENYKIQKKIAFCRMLTCISESLKNCVNRVFFLLFSYFFSFSFCMISLLTFCFLPYLLLSRSVFHSLVHSIRKSLSFHVKSGRDYLSETTFFEHVISVIYFKKERMIRLKLQMVCLSFQLQKNESLLPPPALFSIYV